jgi:hypothetical protein
MKTVPSGMLAATPFSPNSTASVCAAFTTTQITMSTLAVPTPGPAHLAPSLSHEVLDGGRIGIAADDVKPGASKRARHANSHRAEADHRRVTPTAAFIAHIDPR